MYRGPARHTVTLPDEEPCDGCTGDRPDILRHCRTRNRDTCALSGGAPLGQHRHAGVLQHALVSTRSLCGCRLPTHHSSQRRPPQDRQSPALCRKAVMLTRSLMSAVGRSGGHHPGHGSEATVPGYSAITTEPGTGPGQEQLRLYAGVHQGLALRPHRTCPKPPRVSRHNSRRANDEVDKDEGCVKDRSLLDELAPCCRGGGGGCPGCGDSPPADHLQLEGTERVPLSVA